jgi:hypothetical protein
MNANEPSSRPGLRMWSTTGRTPPQPYHAPSPRGRRARPGGIRAVVARRPMTAFLVLTFAPAYPLMSLPILAARGAIPDAWLRIAPDKMAGALLTLGALFAATLIVTWCAAISSCPRGEQFWAESCHRD